MPRLATLVPLLATIAACGDESRPEQTIRLFVGGALADPVTFPTSGEFVIGLVVSHWNGALVSPDSVSVSASLSDGRPLTLVSISREPPDQLPRSVALLIDDSFSMSWNDPGRQRASAALQMWRTVLPSRLGSRFALLDFGHQSTTPGFERTRLLQSWTADTTALSAALTQIGDFEDTYLYTSVREVTSWIDSTTQSGAQKRVLVVLSDGEPDDPEERTRTLATLAGSGVVVHTVGLGPASATSSAAQAEAVRVTRELAGAGRGIYAPAPDQSSLVPVFRALAEVTLKGVVFATFRIDSPVPSGRLVSGSVTARVARHRASAGFTLDAP